MENILKNAKNAERLLTLTSDTMILLNKEGICVDITVYNVDLWFLKEDKLLGKNIFELIPSSTYQQIYPEFKKVLTHKIRSTQNYELNLGKRNYYFKCIMYPYDDMVLCQYRDITERSQRKLELEKKNHELNELQKAALIGRWRYEASTRIFSYHGHTGIMCSEEEQSITLDMYLQNILREDCDTFNNWLERNLKGDIEESVDYRIHFDNQIFYIRLQAFSRERHKSGNIVLEGYIQNITDIQQRRNDINLLTHAINNSIEDIFAAREDGTLVFANRSFKEHHRIGSTEDIAQLKFTDLYSLDQDQGKRVWREMISSAKKDSENNNYIIYQPLEDYPEILAYEGNAYWVPSDEGIETMWVFGRDISQRINHEQQIKRFNQVLDKIIEHLPAGIVVKDIENGYKYLYRNRESYNRSITIQQAIGRDDFDFYPLEIARQKRAQDIEVATTGKEMHWVTEERDVNDKSIFLDKRKIKIESNDFPPILLSIEWDITEVERMKRELLIAKEKAETSDQLKSAFLANMSHEIRTPLNAIVGFSRIIAESEDTEERLGYYEIVEANNERLLKLINEILDLSKIESGIVEFTITPVRLHPLCKEIHDAHVFRCPQGVELIYEPSDENIVIDGDKNRIFQVISNLIGNAFKFTTTGKVSYGYHQEGKNIIFHVTDTGIGIAPDKIDRVFERFVKVNSFAQGTGLGLSICKTIIERLGGNISVSSEYGVGTTFTFTLPCPATSKDENNRPKNEDQENMIPIGDNAEETSTQSDNKNEAQDENSSSLKTILVAEDTDSNYILIKAILGHTYNLQRANDGMEAVTMFEELHPDIILMDMKMPNLGGLDATRIIRELSPDVPIIALTAFAYEHDKQAAFEVGCNDFLTKPFTQEVLKAALNKWLK